MNENENLLFPEMIKKGVPNDLIKCNHNYLFETRRIPLIQMVLQCSEDGPDRFIS